MPGAPGAPVARLGLPAAFYLIATTVLLLDQVAKALVVRFLPLGDRLVIIPRLLYLTHTRNSGAAFGLLPTATVGLIVVGILIIAVMLSYGRRVASCRSLWTGLALQIGGAGGNLLDRILRGDTLLRGQVVDFIDVQITHSFIWPTFNVADIGITVGALLIAYCIVTGRGLPTEGTLKHNEKEKLLR
ncbi:MAG: signal peptidase II [Candidatus Zipacnadales bacterium]